MPTTGVISVTFSRILLSSTQIGFTRMRRLSLFKQRSVRDLPGDTRETCPTCPNPSQKNKDGFGRSLAVPCRNGSEMYLVT